MGMAVGPAKGPKSEINVTPLVDVVLVLLIIFMVVTPMLQRGKAVDLPRASRPNEDDKQADPLVLSLAKDKTVWVESMQYAEADLEGRLVAELRASPNRRILMKGDSELTAGDVRQVMDIARKSGAKGIALAVQDAEKK
jgi:biopolymer transport protein TolR